MPTNRFGPVYQSHKKVRALQIKSVSGYQLVFTDPTVAPIEVPPVMMARYIPAPGDYLVTYDDGYQSFSPKEAFEDGYRLLDAQPAEVHLGD